ncbi:MAG TPA: sugar phosphate isomerase/epimerase family protein [Clostridia bacterium]|nr:sugar phosphate isomerase/epimerase family protein [Clostridia bacterium]
MKLSFSTLGCPRWTLSEITTTAKDLGLDGIEIRGVGNEMYAPDIEDFSNKNLDSTVQKLSKIGLEIPMLTSGAILADKQKAQDSFVEACAYVNLAGKIGVKYIRVMATGDPQVTDGDFELGSKLYGLLCDYASLFDVTPLIETNGALSSSKEILKFIENSGSKNTGILWDIHHTVCYGKESPEKTVKLLGNAIKHVHVKDSALIDGKIEYKMMGHGNIPITDSLLALKSEGYDGFVSLEWVKRWKPDLQEPGIVFAHFKSYMDTLLSNIS